MISYRKIETSKGTRYQKTIEGVGTVFCSKEEYEKGMAQNDIDKPQNTVNTPKKKEKVVPQKEEEGNIWGIE